MFIYKILAAVDNGGGRVLKAFMNLQSFVYYQHLDFKIKSILHFLNGYVNTYPGCFSKYLSNIALNLEFNWRMLYRKFFYDEIAFINCAHYESYFCFGPFIN